MGQTLADTCYQTCGSGTTAKTERINDLEKLLQEQEIAKSDLQKQLKEEVKRYKKHKHHQPKHDGANQKINQLKREKKQVFTSLLQERKNALKLEDEIEDYEKKLNHLESNLHTLETKRQKAEQNARQARFAALDIPKIQSYESDLYNDRSSNTEEEYEDDDEDEVYSLMQSTVILDGEYDAKSEAQVIYSWIKTDKIDFSKRASIVTLKTQLADLLTERSVSHRIQIAEDYYSLYGRTLCSDIEGVLVKGQALQTIRGLLMSQALFDATLINECITSWEIEPIADIICCRSVEELKSIQDAYKQKFKGRMKKMLQTLANKKNKHTLVKVIGHLLDLDRKESIDVDLKQVNKDVKFVLESRSFKKATKEKLILVFTTNSVQYIKVFNDQFKLRSKDSLTLFIDKNLGPKSTAGYFCKTRISYALCTFGYYAEKIKSLGRQFKKNQKQISDILIQRMEIDLDKIDTSWKMKGFANKMELSVWIAMKTSNSMSGYLLTQMVKNSHRYTEFNKMVTPKRTQIDKIQQMMMGTGC